MKKNRIVIERPLIGVMPRKLHEEQVNIKRFQDVCHAIKRYWDANRKIPVEWIQEYNDLIDFFNKNNIKHA